MNVRRLVFLTLFAAFTAGHSTAQSALVLDPAKLRLASLNAVIVDASANRSVYAKGADAVTPIASLTKLMTAMVTLDAGLPPDETITIDMQDLDFLKGSHSRLRMGAELPRSEMLRLALMSSENRAASSLARTYPGGTRLRRRDERQGAALRDAHTRYADDGTFGPERVDGERPRPARGGGRSIRRSAISAPPATVCQCSRGADPGLQQHQQPCEERPVGHQAVQDRVIREAGSASSCWHDRVVKPFVIVADSAGKYTRLATPSASAIGSRQGETLPATAEAKPAAKARKAKPVAYRAPARRIASRI
jgi:hypothetical protein